MSPNRSLLTLCALLVGCGGILDDDDGEPAVLATSSGAVQRISATEELVSISWSGTIDASNTVGIIDDGRDVFISSGQEVRAFDDGAGGAQLWDPAVSFATQVVAIAGPAGGALFVLTIDSLVAIQVSDGAELWRAELFDLGDPADDALAVVGSGVFLGGNPISRLDVSDGTLTHTAPGSATISALVGDGSTIYVGGPNGVTAFAASNLSQSWHHDTDGSVDDLVVGGGSIFYSVFGGGGGVGLLTTSGNPVGTAEPDEVFQALAIGGNLLLGARADGTLVALDELDLSEVWVVTGDSDVGGLALNSQTVFYVTGGALDGLNLSDGDQIFPVFSGNGSIVGIQAL
jgi:hypothetical protein